MIGFVDVVKLQEEISQLKADRALAKNQVTRDILTRAIRWKDECIRNYRKRVQR